MHEYNKLKEQFPPFFGLGMVVTLQHERQERRKATSATCEATWLARREDSIVLDL